MKEILLYDGDEKPAGSFRIWQAKPGEEPKEKPITHECELSARLRVPIKYERHEAFDMIDGEWIYRPDNYWVAGEDYECVIGIIYCPYCRKELATGGQEEI